MLVLERRPVDGFREIRIGDDIVITLLSVKGEKKDRVRIGVTAPDEQLILRGEVEARPVNREKAEWEQFAKKARG